MYTRPVQTQRHVTRRRHTLSLINLVNSTWSAKADKYGTQITKHSLTRDNTRGAIVHSRTVNVRLMGPALQAVESSSHGFLPFASSQLRHNTNLPSWSDLFFPRLFSSCQNNVTKGQRGAVCTKTLNIFAHGSQLSSLQPTHTHTLVKTSGETEKSKFETSSRVIFSMFLP